MFHIREHSVRKTPMMEFILEKSTAYIVQSTILLFADFTTDNIWSRFPKLVV